MSPVVPESGSEERVSFKAKVLGSPQLDLVSTLILDGIVIAVAVLIRSGLLILLEEWAPEGARNWAITALEIVTDTGLVGIAFLYTAFDLLKRAIRYAKEVRDEIKK